MKRYFLINSAVITSPGVYAYRTIQPIEALKWLHTHPFESFIGYRITRNQLSLFSGLPIPLNRSSFVMEPGDEALVVRLKYRVDDPAKKRSLEPVFPDDYEFGILTKLDQNIA